jgi:hypothetical protein
MTNVSALDDILLGKNIDNTFYDTNNYNWISSCNPFNDRIFLYPRAIYTREYCPGIWKDVFFIK